MTTATTKKKATQPIVATQYVYPTFRYNGEPYQRIIPAKKLFNSTMIHEVVNRGDFFALNVRTLQFTILPNGADTVENN